MNLLEKYPLTNSFTLQIYLFKMSRENFSWNVCILKIPAWDKILWILKNLFVTFFWVESDFPVNLTLLASYALIYFTKLGLSLNSSNFALF